MERTECLYAKCCSHSSQGAKADPGVVLPLHRVGEEGESPVVKDRRYRELERESAVSLRTCLELSLTFDSRISGFTHRCHTRRAKHTASVPGCVVRHVSRKLGHLTADMLEPSIANQGRARLPTSTRETGMLLPPSQCYTTFRNSITPTSRSQVRRPRTCT